MPKHKQTHMHRHTLTHIVPWLRSIRRTVLHTGAWRQRLARDMCVCVCIQFLFYSQCPYCPHHLPVSVVCWILLISIWMPEDDDTREQARLRSQLQAEGAQIRPFFFCPTWDPYLICFSNDLSLGNIKWWCNHLTFTSLMGYRCHSSGSEDVFDGLARQAS